MTKEKGTWPKVRKFFNDLHLWMGLASGIIIFIVCLSGTIYVFNTEFREMAAPQLYNVSVPANKQKLSAEELIAIVQKQSGGKVSSIKIPADEQRSYMLTVKKKDGGKQKGGNKGENRDGGKSSRRDNQASDQKNQEAKTVGAEAKKGGGRKGGPDRGTPYMVNPYTGEVLGDLQTSKTATSEFMQLMFSLHRWLLLDKIEEPLFGELENRKLGSYITGAATILFTLGVLTGIVIWFPRKLKNWRQGLKVKGDGNWKRLNHDLHNSLGFYSCILLLLMGLTGPQWSFPWYRDGLRKTLGTYQPEDAPKPEAPKSTIIEMPARKLALADFKNIADKELTYAGDYTIQLPADSAGVITLAKNKTGFFAPAAADKILLDQYSGKLLAKEIFTEKNLNERITGSIKALHMGDVYGMFSKILYFIACLIATSLPVTGTLIWWNKLKKKNKAAVKTKKIVRV